MRFGVLNLKAQFDKHPLEAHLQKWNETQTNIHDEMTRNVFGIGALMRIQEERKLCRFSVADRKLDEFVFISPVSHVARNPHVELENLYFR